MAGGGHPEQNGRRLMATGQRTVGGGAADSDDAGDGDQGPPGQVAGPDLAGDLDKRRRSRDLAGQLLSRARPADDLQRAGQAC